MKKRSLVSSCACFLLNFFENVEIFQYPVQCQYITLYRMKEFQSNISIIKDVLQKQQP